MADHAAIQARLDRVGAELASIRRELQALGPETRDGLRTQGELVQNMGQAITNVNQTSLYLDEIK